MDSSGIICGMADGGWCIYKVSINYNRFVPNREGFISMTNLSYVQNALNLLPRSSIGGYHISAVPCDSLVVEQPVRTRGFKGRAEAAERGIISGDGPSAGISRQGRNVILYGLPYRLSAPGLRSYLRNFQLEDISATGEEEVIKIEPYVVPTIFRNVADVIN